MRRTLLVLCVVAMVGLAGCSGGDGGSGGDDATSDPVADADGTSDGDGEDSDAGESDADVDDGDGSETGTADVDTADGGGSAAALPEIAMLQFDRTERYEYATSAYGRNSTTVVDVGVADGEATIEITNTAGDAETVNAYVVPANDPEAVVDAMSDDIREGGVAFVLQSRDVSGIFVQNDVAFGPGASYENAYGNLTVTGEDTVGGVACLTYEFRVDGTLAETGCLSESLELPVEWEKYDGEGGVRQSFRLVSYESADARFLGHAIAAVDA